MPNHSQVPCFYLQTNFHVGDEKAFAQTQRFHTVSTFYWLSWRLTKPLTTGFTACLQERAREDRSVRQWLLPFSEVSRNLGGRISDLIGGLLRITASHSQPEVTKMRFWLQDHRFRMLCPTHLQQLVHGLKGGHLHLRRKPSCEAGTIQTCAQGGISPLKTS